MKLLHLILLAIAIVIPIAGFIAMVGYSRKATTLADARWRKRHGIIFWVLIPAVLGALGALGTMGVLPSLVGLMSILAFGLTTSVSLNLRKQHDEKEG